jgi:hypothetical protein
MHTDSRTTRPATEAERATLRSLIDAEGEGAALRAVGLSRMGAYRVLAGLAVTSGTRALLREALHRTCATVGHGLRSTST